MFDYQKQANDFLSSGDAKIKINFVGCEVNQTWGDNIPRNKYNVTISTSKGRMRFHFWDSIANMNGAPSAYDVLACLTKYDPGTMYDFFNEMGYEIKSSKDNSRFTRLYKAVVKEYQSLCKIFTEEQIETLREIQ